MSTSTDLMTTLAWSLLHFLWQGAAIAALAAAAMQLFGKSTTRYFVGIVALALMCLSFGATFALLTGAPAAGSEAAASAPAMSPQVATPASAAGVVTLSVAGPAAPWLDFAWIARVWLAGVCLLALRVAGGLLLLEHLRRRSLSTLPVEIVERCLALQRTLGISRVVRYCECRLVTVPAVIGFVRPIVLLPMRALTGLTAEQLEIVIAHELGHIKRFDVAINLFQVVVETLFFFHPAVWWLNRRIRADREDCCDDIAIAACGRSIAYARALTIMDGWRGAPELSMAATGGDAASRVARLLGIGRQTGVRSTGVLTAAFVLAAALLAGAASIGLAQPELTTRFAPPVETFAQVDVPLEQVSPITPAPADATPAPAAAPLVVAPPAPPVDVPPLELVAQVDAPRAQTPPRTESPRRAQRAQTPATPNSPSYIDDMKAAGLDTSDVETLIGLKIHGVTGDYVRAMRDAGLTVDAEEVVGMKIHGVTPEYVAQVRAMGFEPDTEEIVGLKIHGVTPEYIEQIRAMGFAFDAEEVVGLKIHGVTPEYIKEMRDAGFELDADDIAALKIHDITPEFIEEARSHGFDDLSVEQLVQLKNAGVL
jgi:beta-lactamase regulating signal transducer with metallopeptidase domain